MGPPPLLLTTRLQSQLEKVKGLYLVVVVLALLPSMIRLWEALMKQTIDLGQGGALALHRRLPRQRDLRPRERQDTVQDRVESAGAGVVEELPVRPGGRAHRPLVHA